MLWAEAECWRGRSSPTQICANTYDAEEICPDMTLLLLEPLPVE